MMMDRLESKVIPCSRILLDPNNYRFHEAPGYVPASQERFHEDSVQKTAFERLKNEGLQELKESIKTNGFLPIEPLVVRPYPHLDNMWVVVEGNRRLAALRWLCRDDEGGVSLPQHVLDTLEGVSVLVVAEGLSPIFQAAVMGIRHVSGIKPWGGYQRSKLIAALRDDHSLDLAEIAARLGMSAQEVNRRYRAYKALEQMQLDEEYGSYTGPDLYPIFHEAVSLPVVREWLGWDEGQTQFLDVNALSLFYQLITQQQDENGERHPPKITTYQQVRALRDILPNEEAKRILIDPGRNFTDADAIARQEALSRSWRGDVAAARRALSNIPHAMLKRMPAEEIAVIEELCTDARELIDNYRRLTAAS